MTEQHFKATIVKSGTRVYLAVPFDPNQVWGAKEAHHIHGAINGSPVRGALDWDGDQYCLLLGPAWRRDSGLEAGAEVEVSLSPGGPQSANVAADVAGALAAEPQARSFFDALPTFYRNNYMRWIDSAKRIETRNARISEMVALLKAGKRQR